MPTAGAISNNNDPCAYICLAAYKVEPGIKKKEQVKEGFAGSWS
jgi:hypothetical protein